MTNRHRRRLLTTLLKVGLGAVLGVLAVTVFSCGKLLPPPLPEVPPTPLYFGENDGVLDAAGETAIDALAGALRAAHCPPLRVRAYSTPSGPADRNAHLAWQRACWVVDSLALAGVDPGCFRVEAIGERQAPDVPVEHRRAVVVDLPPDG